MGVVTGGTRHLAALKTGRLAQAVCAARNLEFVIAAAPWRVIEMNEVVPERPSGDIRKRRMLVAANLERQRAARRFEVALHAREKQSRVSADRLGDLDRFSSRRERFQVERARHQGVAAFEKDVPGSIGAVRLRRPATTDAGEPVRQS